MHDDNTREGEKAGDGDCFAAFLMMTYDYTKLNTVIMALALRLRRFETVHVRCQWSCLLRQRWQIDKIRYY